MYPEDIDLSRRLALRYKTIFYPFSSIYHEYGGASKKSLRMLFIHALNIVWYFNKWGWFIDEERAILNTKTLSQIPR
jgi:GT2 family glycosyltransferase